MRTFSGVMLALGVVVTTMGMGCGSRATAYKTQKVSMGQGVSMEFVWCPPTTSDDWKKISGGEDFFLMGSPEGESGRNADEIQHKVRLTKGFWISRYEITQALFGFPGSKLPQETRSWEHGREFIEDLNKGVSGGAFRMPTEAEWEYACRAGSTNALNSAKELTRTDERCKNLDAIAWYSENLPKMGKYARFVGGTVIRTSDVGQRRPNAWGLYDMSGNVAEWCEDWYGEYPSDIVIDPIGPGSGTKRVIRGGGYLSSAGACRTAARNAADPSGPGMYYPDVGFRLVWTPQASADPAR